MNRYTDPISGNSLWHSNGPTGTLPQNRNDQFSAHMAMANRGFYRLVLGTIAMTCPAHGYYLVNAAGQSSVPCFDAAAGFGSVRVFHAYTPGTQVLLALPEHPGDQQPGIIIMAGSWATNNDLYIPTWQWPFDVLSFKDDEMIMTLWNADSRTQMILDGSGRAMDMMAGDWQVLNEMDGGLGVGLLKVWAGFGDMGGLEAYFDGLTRLRGRHIDIQSMGRDLRIHNDTSLIAGIEKIYMYGWESVGLRKPGEATREGKGQFEPSVDEPVLMPKQEFQMGRPRFWRFEGGLSQGKREIMLYPYTPDDAPLSRKDGEGVPHWYGLYEHYVGIGGEVFTRSARSIMLEKTSVFPVPVPLREPDDPDGTLDPIRSKSEKELRAKTWPTFDKAHQPSMLMDDYRAYVLNHKSLIFFQACDKDWKYLQDKDMTFAVGAYATHQIQPFGQNAYADLPSFGEMEIDAQAYGQIRIYSTTSRVSLNEDGSVAIQDGYGSEILLAGGNITISCAGDLFLRSGRSIVNLAASDVILRAGGNVEASSSLGDVRIKAERNVLVLAGNGYEGGILLESQSQAGGLSQDKEDEAAITDVLEGGAGDDLKINGVMIKSPHAPLVTVTAEQWHKTKLGPYVFKTGEGENPTFMVEAFKIHMKSSSSTYHKAPVYQVEASQMISDGFLNHRGGAFFTGTHGPGQVLIDGSLSSVSGNTSTPRYFFEPMATALLAQTDELKKQRTEGVEDPVHAVLEILYTDDFQKTLVFSFRSSEELPCPRPLLPESLWQRMYRQHSRGSSWTEPAVKFDAKDTFPWPGKANWNEESIYLTCDPVLSQADSQHRWEDRPYNDPEDPTIEDETMAEKYLVTYQPRPLIRGEDK